MAYVPPLNGGRINASIGGNTAGASTLISTGTMVLAGGNNIVLSQNGNSITISGSNAAAGSINFSASNTSANLASVTFSNSNGVSFGLNAGVITASHNALTSQSSQAVSGSNGSFTFQTLSFANSNGISFATGTQGVYASVGAGADGYNAAQFTNSTANSTMPIVWAGNSAGSGNVTMGLTGSTVTASASFNQSVQTQNMVSINGSTGNVSLVGGNNITLSQNASTMTISAAPMLDIGVAGTAAGGTTAGNTGSNTNGIYLYAGSNINLSQGTDTNGASITISAANGGGGGLALANSQTTYSTGTANLNVAGGAMTIASTTGQSFNFSVPATSSLSATGAVSLSTNGQTISIGAPTQSNQQMSLYAVGNTVLSTSNTINASAVSVSGMGPISVGMSNGSVQVSAPNYGTIGNWEPQQLQYVSMTASQPYIANTPYFFKLQPQGNVSATQLQQLVSQSLSVSSNSSYGGRITLSAGIYSANGSTLSLITQSSGTATYQYTISGTTNSSLYSGVKGLSVPMNAVMPPGNYWLGIMSNTALVNVGWFSLSNMVISNNVPAFSNMMGQAVAGSAGMQEAVGAYSTTLAALPTSAAMSNILQSNAPVPMPYLNFKSKTY